MLSVDRALSDIDAIGIGRKGTIDKPYLLKAPFWTVDTFASWVTREKSVESLPAAFIYSLSLSSGKNMSEVYNDLLDIQTQKWHSIQGKHRKKERLDS